VKDRKLSRRDFLLLSGGVGVGTLLAACGPTPTPQVIREEVEVTRVVEGETVIETVVTEVEVPVEVEVTAPPAEVMEIRLAEGSWVGPEGIAFWTDDIIPRFEGDNPTIKVTFENAESPDYSDKLYTQAVAGDAPDVMFVWGSICHNLMQRGQFLALDDYFGSEALADFYPAKVTAHQYEGHLYGMPKYVSTIAMAYNKTILDAAGVEYPDNTWDWNDYLEAYIATTDSDTGQWGTYVSTDYLEQYVWANGGEWMNADIFGDKCLLNEEKAMEALKYNYDLIWGSNPVSPKPGGIPEMSWSNVFSTGKIAFVESHSWTVTNYIRENDFDWDFIDLPAAPGGGKAGQTFTDGYGIYVNTAYPDAAIKMVEFLTGSWAQKAMCLSIVGLQPTRISVAPIWDTESMGARAGYDVAAFTRVMEHARLEPAFKENEKVNEVFNPIWEQIWVTGDIGLEEGIELIVQRVDEIFA
jgi:ABC-type glycerol-3-phosphate transport system substrate-binding protein